MILRSKKLAILMLVSILTVTTSAYAYNFWISQQNLIVILKNVQAIAANSVPNVAAGISATSWVRTDAGPVAGFSDDHHYVLYLGVSQIVQVDSGFLKIECAGVPSYLSLNITSISVYTAGYIGPPDLWAPGASPTMVLATNRPMNSSIAFNKADILENMVPSSSFKYVLIILSEYQIAPSGTDISKTLTPIISIGQ